MNVTVIQRTKRYTVVGSQITKRFEVNGTQTIKRYGVTVAQLGKQGFTGLSNFELAVKNGLFQGTESEYLLSLVPNFSILGNYERDFSNDFLIALNT